MKGRFNTYDIVCSVTELQKLVGLRVNQVYDIDNKTYLIRFQQQEVKYVLLLESPNRFHLTQYDWPKNNTPSGFTMKLRKHLKNKRLEHIRQLGIDRVIDLQFGSGEAANHVILKLYDRGNLLLTDYDMTILIVLRPELEGEDVRFAVREKYPLERAKQQTEPYTEEKLRSILESSKPNDNLKKVLNPHFNYGGALLEHVLIEVGLSANKKVSQTLDSVDLLRKAMLLAEVMVNDASKQASKGYIIKKREQKPTANPDEPDFLLTYEDFNPFLFHQCKEKIYTEFETFDQAVDDFFSSLEGQKIDLKVLQTQREAVKKLQNVRDDQSKRLTELEKVQQEDQYKAELIIRNQDLCNQILLFVQSSIAKQLSWDEVEALVSRTGGPLKAVKKLSLASDKVSVHLTDPYEELTDRIIELDLGLTALANANRYFKEKRSAAVKQQKTIEAQMKALKNAEKKTKKTLRDVQVISNISKTRKTYWFEKFYWFISSDNYLVIAGRDQQQNEFLVKRHMKANDIYVHADLTGASSVIIKSAGIPPPKTLHEAGQLAIAYSAAWEAKIAASSWWVHGCQVSKTAPTGEYLATGSFMIRGKKNYLPMSPLSLGFSFMFRLDDSSIERHAGERSSVNIDATETESVAESQNEEEIALSNSEDETSNDEHKERAVLEESTNKLETLAVDNEKIGSPSNTEDKSNENEDCSLEDELLDTHIKVDHQAGKVIAERTKSVSISDEVHIPSFPAMPKKSADKRPPPKQKNLPKETKNDNQPKRGKQGKLKKMKEKYKDQDEEDREYALAVSRAAGPPKPPKKSTKKNIITGSSKPAKIPAAPPTILHEELDDEPEVVEEKAEGVSDEISMLRQLTGKPFTEDDLVFALPVIAPYNTLHDYKFKVKLTPGTGKRGKAAKTALELFIRDKNCSQREKDLLKSVKDQDLARNFPGKVKLSAPHLHK